MFGIIALVVVVLTGIFVCPLMSIASLVAALLWYYINPIIAAIWCVISLVLIFVFLKRIEEA